MVDPISEPVVMTSNDQHSVQQNLSLVFFALISNKSPRDRAAAAAAVFPAAPDNGSRLMR